MRRRRVSVALLASACGVLSACSGARSESAPAAVTAPPAAPVGAAEPDRSHLPEPGPTPAWVPPSPKAWTLPNGVQVLYRKHGDVPLVSLLVVIPRGSETDPVGKDGLTSLMVDLLDEGAGSLGALQLSEKLQALATDFRAAAAVDSVVLSMHLIAENFAPSVALLADMVRHPRFEQQEFERRKAQLVAQAIAMEADPHVGRRAAMYRALFGQGYAGAQPTGTRDTLQSIKYADVKAHYAKLVEPQDVTFVVTGGIDEAAVAEQLKHAFGDWAGKATTQARPLQPTPGAGKLYLVDYPGAAQSVIGLVRRAPGSDAEDLFPSTVFNRSFGEAFTSRVNLNLREDKGYTYGALSIFQRFRQTGIFGVFSDVRSDVTRASLDQILKELSDICGPRPLAREERDDSVNGLLLGYPATFESIELLGSRFSQLPIYKRPLDWFERWPSRVSAVTLEQANQAALQYCPRSEFAMVVAGDAAKVVPTLDGVGFELVRVDARGNPR
jgi:zinc protease